MNNWKFKLRIFPHSVVLDVKILTQATCHQEFFYFYLWLIHKLIYDPGEVRCDEVSFVAMCILLQRRKVLNLMFFTLNKSWFN